MKKDKVGGLTLPTFKTHYTAIAINTVWYGRKKNNTDQWNRRETHAKMPNSFLTKVQKKFNAGKDRLVNK